MIKASRAIIEWNYERGTMRLSEDVLVRDKDEAPAATEIYDCSAGADTAGWCISDDPRDNPAGVFAAILFRSFHPSPTRSALRAWLDEFSKIEECEWARQMTRQMAADDRRAQGESA